MDSHLPAQGFDQGELRKLGKLDAALQRCNIRISNYLSTTDSKRTIPGIKGRSATAIIAEVGSEVSSFEDAAHLVSWCGLKPRNEESAGKIKARSITHGNKYLRKTLIECSWAASKTRNCYFSKFSYTQIVVRRKNKMKVQVAIARKILTAVWHVLHDNAVYRDHKPSNSDIAPADK